MGSAINISPAIIRPYQTLIFFVPRHAPFITELNYTGTQSISPD